MQLNTGDFIAEEFMFHGNIVDVISVNFAEHTSHMAHDSILAAVIDHIVPNDVGTDGFFAPPDLQGTEYGLHLVLISRFSVMPGAQIVARGRFFSDTDAAAFDIMDDIILNDPSFAPVDAQ